MHPLRGAVSVLTILAAAALVRAGRDDKAVVLPKVGTGYGFQRPDDLAALQGLSWWYDWSTEPNPAALSFSLDHEIDYVPTQWGPGKIEQLISSPSLRTATALLSFNEPNHKDQANIAPAEVAKLWPFLEAAAKKFNLRLGSPMPANCEINCVVKSPFDFWDQFFAACPGCKVDFLAVHIYTCKPEDVSSFITQCKKYKLPIWVTEFACNTGQGNFDDQQLEFMKVALEILDKDNDVERYAWFSARSTDPWVGSSASLLVPDEPTLTPLGRTYLELSPGRTTASTATVPSQFPAGANPPSYSSESRSELTSPIQSPAEPPAIATDPSHPSQSPSEASTPVPSPAEETAEVPSYPSQSPSEASAPVPSPPEATADSSSSPSQSPSEVASPGDAPADAPSPSDETGHHALTWDELCSDCLKPNVASQCNIVASRRPAEASSAFCKHCIEYCGL